MKPQRRCAHRVDAALTGIDTVRAPVWLDLRLGRTLGTVLDTFADSVWPSAA